MRLHRLRIVDTAAVREVDVAFGPGLNVLHGPNDLGKSTMADAIRLVLLLPHGSSHSESFVPWTGGGDPQVTLTFQTEEQRFWRVTKRFGTSGMSLLEESRDGKDFDEIAKSRGVDGKLRELLRWGIPEPGGAGGSRSFPTSFLATVLLSTQDAVGAVLKDSLGDDPDLSGKERITAALNAVAQDPLFKSLLQQAQERRDEAYTPTGGRKQSKASPFKTAAERVNKVRTEKELWQAAVDESESIEASLRELASRKGALEESLANASSQVAAVEMLVLQTKMLSEADERVRLARENVDRIQRLTSDVTQASDAARDLEKKLETASTRLNGAEKGQSDAETTLEAEAKKTRAAAAAAAAAAMTSRQALEARRVAAEGARDASQRRIEHLGTAQALVDAATAADQLWRERQSDADKARISLDDFSGDAQVADERLRRVELLVQASQVQLAESQLVAAQTEVEKRKSTEARLLAAVKDRESLAQRRAGVVVPEKSDIVNMRRLSQELAGARGALEVGLQVAVTRKSPIEVRAQRDGVPVDDVPATGLVNVEADVAIDIEIGDIATVQIRGGARDAQENVRSLEERWQKEVVPHLDAAKVTDLETLDRLVDDAREIDEALKVTDAELGALRTQIESLASVAETLRAAEARVVESRSVLGDRPIESLLAELSTLGSNPQGSLHKQREQASSALETVRAAAKEAEISQSIAEDRLKHANAELEKANKSRDEAVTALPGDLAGELTAARSAFDAAVVELEKVGAELNASDQTAAQQAAESEEAVASAQAAVDSARSAVETARAEHQRVLTAHASEEARSKELRRLLEAEDLAKAENALADATTQHAALPKPDHMVTELELNAARNAEAKAESDLKAADAAIQQKHGALQHVGGMVAHDRLRDATEALALAEQHEREVEVDSEAWKLLLDQMREAESTQASNLGLALAPSISAKFEELTKKRYDGVQLTNELGTDGVVMGGAVRPSDRLSVGTREQLSTLYRLALAESLQTAVVLDDQLVQSDNSRMDWFRKLLVEKARAFQIVVFTCRPDDYLAPAASAGPSVSADSDDGFVRAIDLRLAVRSR
jgi:hypothetical protein